MNKILVTLAALAMPAVFAFVGAPAASANPELSWNGFVLHSLRAGTRLGRLEPGVGRRRLEQQALEPWPRPLEVRQSGPLRCRRR